MPSNVLGLHLHDLEFYLYNLKAWAAEKLHPWFSHAHVFCLQSHHNQLYKSPMVHISHKERPEPSLASWRLESQPVLQVSWNEMLYLIPGTNSRPPDVCFPNWMKGQPAGLDVTVTSSIQQLTCKGLLPHKAMSWPLVRRRKMSAYKESCCALVVTLTFWQRRSGWEVVHTISNTGILGQCLWI